MSGVVGEAVARAEAQLSAFWATATDESGLPKARASTMNFVAVGSTQEVAALRAEIEKLAEVRAGRVFLLSLDGRLPPWEVEPDVSAVCHKEGELIVCYDRVELAFGAAAAGRAASVLSALALPEVPKVLEISAGAPSVLVDPIVPVADRIILDSARIPLARVAEIARRTRVPIGDRAFVRTFSWRELIARFFDEALPAVRAIRRVEIERTVDGKYDPAALLLGWLASRLGWRFEGKDRAIDARGDEVVIDARGHSGADVGPGELAGVRISTSLDGAPLELACARGRGRRVVHWTMTGALEASHDHPLGYHDEGWVLLKAIDAIEGDHVYREAALAAAELERAMIVASPAHEVLIARDRDEHTAFAAELLGRAIQDAVRERGVARVALSGGTTPSDAYRKLASFVLPWDRVEWFWVDERAVPPGSPRSNYGAAASDLGFPRGRAHRMEADAPDLAAAASYEALLRRSFGVAAAVAFDAVTLGVGDDGHTASLFPGLGVVGIDDRLVIAVPEQPDKKLEARLTLTAPVLCEARLALVLARGANKKAVVAAARSPGSEEEIPARLLLRAKGRVVWVLDQEATG